MAAAHEVTPLAVKEIFLEACELPADQRGAFLDARCGKDAEKRAAVQALLDAHDRAGEFLAGPTLGHKAIPASDSTHQQIGPYKLVHIIGEGGFGTVYMAEQTHPVRRRVALKIIKLGMDTQQVIARFEAERQALAMMDHPNIARVFDAGATQTGRPYFVMELVGGVPITQYCDENQLALSDRLALFAQVCQAVQHAHEKGIIHRDIKPSNILVSTQDGRPLAKVIDFGIAKATEARLTDRTLFTEFRQLIGTPEYMSPEQASGNLDVDTRSDIYSLGVLLYELLTGTTPFDGRELRSKAYAEIQRVISEVDPPRPSTRLSALDAKRARDIARARSVVLDSLRAQLRRELEWIPLKAMRKDRTQRYRTAGELADDVSNYLQQKPLIAAPESKRYRFRKLLRRHRGPVIASAALLLVLIAGIIGTTIGLIGQAHQRVVAEEQRGEALRQEKEARNQAAIADAVSQFQSDMLASADPEKLLGDKVTVLQAVSAAVKELDGGKLKNQPVVEASVRATIGSTLLALGRYDAAEPNLRKALELRQKALRAGHPLIAASLTSLAMLLGREGKYDQAESLFREGLEIHRAAQPPAPGEVAASLYNLGVLNQQRGRPIDAEPFFREALDLRRKIYPAAHLFVSQSLVGLAEALREQRNLDEAEPLFREALQINRKSLPAEHPAMVPALTNLGALLWSRGKFSEAEPLAREGLAIRRKTLPADHPDIALTLGNLALLLRMQDKSSEAEPLCREALEIRRKTLPPEHPLIANSAGMLALLLRDQGKFDEAEPLCREALEIQRKAFPPGSVEIAQTLLNLGWLLELQSRLTEAESAYRQALESLQRKFDNDNWQVANARMALGHVFCAQNRPAEAEAALLEAERVLAKAPGTPPGRHEECIRYLVELYEGWDKVEPGKGYDAKARRWKEVLPATTPAAATTQFTSERK
jgi:eukaryotic-like serine/threonine-protein kinase